MAARSFIVGTALATACVSTPNVGPVGDESRLEPRILSIDSVSPPGAATVQLAQPGYAALLLVAPGHSATLLYPRDSATNNQLTAGSHRVTFEVPTALILSDTASLNRTRARRDTASGRARIRTATNPPIDPSLPSYLLLLTSPQRLDYARMVERTLGVSLPTNELEALNAIAKAVKGTLAAEPREVAGYFHRVQLGRTR